MTLSHRWGAETFKLQQSTQGNMLRGLPVSVLPGTYQDAVRVARRFNVRYLWIDSICIFQDERLDIQNEASMMAEVFGNATCNISALSGRHDSLFCTRVPDVVNSDCVLLEAQACNLRQSYLLNDLQLWRGELLHMPLTTRGWVLQEELLAPRTIYFGNRQVLWDCAGFRACETYPVMQQKRPLHVPPEFNDKTNFLHDEEIGPIASVLRVAKASVQTPYSESDVHERQQMLFDVWTRLVAHYSLRELTFPTDKLLAIAGVSKLFGTVMQDQSVAGLWRRHLMDSLLWYVRANTSTSRPLEYRAPSWSWASNDGYVLHAEPFSMPWTVARALNAECETEGGGEYGVVVSARLRLQAALLCMSIDHDGNWTASNGRFSEKLSIRKMPRLIVRLDTTEDLSRLTGMLGAIIRTTAYRLTDTASGSGDTTVNGKILLAAHGIILAPVKAAVRDIADDCISQSNMTLAAATEFRRVGYFALEDRRSGSLTPKWVPEGCRIFHGPLGQGVDGQGRRLKEFDFDGQSQWLKVVDIV
ncbi:hypothetical protein A1O1_07709 [Capronia coronata CBS 617.96]|uniref:Heterokaryon incompatibility domain-containing protein n=1 Tax=Capronia coronata CBS 617.96 TaxID=1182541 RepID=W9YH84_9EURO|nr:uncharacterized protein A1O1_07709 [Capronia coronata CBS 617.96]EXJ81644.1 hypothetical protein A1O1_07709 [Capronia coronata CBS 617.96]